jgi:mRNA interferase RelE/StbE
MVDVEISVKARDELDALDPPAPKWIRDKLLNEVAEQPQRHLVPLSGRSDYRVRVGDYRVIVDWDKSEDLLRVTKVEKRDTVYD